MRVLFETNRDIDYIICEKKAVMGILDIEL
jgi:hypothetical protein